jgi:hypothetical protein
MPPESKGKTLWEMLQERLHRSSNGNGSSISFLNPLEFSVGSSVPLSFANGPDFANIDFTVKEIREYNRRIGGKDYPFTDYVLRGVNSKTFDNEMVARVRAIANDAGGHDALLLSLYDEFAFSEDFLAVVKDDTGVLDITQDKTGDNETFTRINDVRGSYEAAILIISETTPDGKAPPRGTAAAKAEYWDYWREVDLGNGKTAREFVFVEMNSENGWFQIWRGREFFQ